MSAEDLARVEAYARPMRAEGIMAGVPDFARIAVAVADAEQAELRAEVERLRGVEARIESLAAEWEEVSDSTLDHRYWHHAQRVRALAAEPDEPAEQRPMCHCGCGGPLTVFGHFDRLTGRPATVFTAPEDLRAEAGDSHG